MSKQKKYNRSQRFGSACAKSGDHLIKINYSSAASERDEKRGRMN